MGRKQQHPTAHHVASVQTGRWGTVSDRGAAQTDALGCRMEEAVVKQGVLHLQLQQTFGKVRVQHGGGGLPAGVRGGCKQ